LITAEAVEDLEGMGWGFDGDLKDDLDFLRSPIIAPKPVFIAMSLFRKLDS
jgi:hypothetical protein